MSMSRTDTLSSTYNPAEVESRWYDRWVERGDFRARPELDRPRFTVTMPPPNVTGQLTMGHMLGESIRDVLVRWQRMEGRDVLYLPGMDHAGIATQNVVERKLEAEGKSRHVLGRVGFLNEAWAWKEEYGGKILEQLRRVGVSVDWSRERFTLDEGYSRAVVLVFKRLYEKGLVYRGHYIVNWCPRCHTALSDEQVEHQEVDGQLYYLRYPLQGAEGKFVTVATTRPETMLGDVGVAVNPKDRRFKKLVGKSAVLPFLRREIPIIADDAVDPKFGAGALKVTPAHDPVDLELGRRHGLEPVVVIDTEGKMTANAGDFAGLDRFEARKRVVARLTDLGLLEKVEPYRYSRGTCERCETVIEPYLSEQWFVRMAPLAQPAIEAARRNQIKFFPKRWRKVYLHWLENVHDWCISRQLWWGHRIPVWYCRQEGCGAIAVELERPGPCLRCGADRWEQDEDVLDTWFSSWLWPFATVGWPERTRDLEAYYPNSLMVTAPDIIFSWVVRMVMAGQEFAGGVPFPHVLLTSIVRDAVGQKMSKSLGNSPDPIELMDRYGADALRFTMVYLTPSEQDLLFDEKRCETGKFFANKVWNAARLVLSRLGDEDPRAVREASLELQLADRWILSRLADAIKDTTRYLKTYRLNEAANTVYHFTWHAYCDWYLEMVKPRWADDADPRDRRVARWVAWKVLDGILRLLHPFMPFVTEELWQALPHEGETLATAEWPKARRAWFDATAEAQVAFLQEVVVAVRNLRAEMNVPPGRRVQVVVRGSEEQLDLLQRLTPQILPLARLEIIQLARDGSRPPVAASTVVNGAEVFLPLEGLVDVDAERARLAREADRLLHDLEASKKKLHNQDFLAKAKPEVVERERQKLQQFEETLEKLKRAQEALRQTSA
jgi:valyl-tRNA synthetase